PSRFAVAYAWRLAQQRRVTGSVGYEMLLGMATGQAAAVRKAVGQLLLSTPVVNPAEFDVAIAYLVRRLEENASSENFMSAVFELSSNPELLQRERERFERSLAALETAVVVPAPNRTQDRAAESADADSADAAHTGFANEPDSDPALAANR